MRLANFTPQEIEQFLQEFFDVVGTRQYIGARYVPIFGRKDETSIDWDNSAPYEPLTIVIYQGNSYTSRTYVPAGVDIANTDYWAKTGNYNAQVEAYRQEVGRFTDSIQDKSFAFETVAEMQEYDNLYEGCICHTNGFHTSGDGGAAWYIVSSGVEANGMDVISCANNLIASYVRTDEYVTPEQFGAVGDGVSDDTEYIQFAIDNYLCVQLLNKTYAVRSINLKQCAKINGVGWNSILKPISLSAYVLNLQYVANVGITNLAIANSDVIVGGYFGHGIKLSHPERIGHDNTWSNYFYNLRLYGLQDGVTFSNDGASSADTDYTSETSFINCKIFECDVPVYNECPQSVNNSFINCQIERNNRSGVSSKPLISIGSGEMSFYNCSLIGDGSIVEFIRMPNHTTYTHLPTINIHSCRIELHKATSTTKYLFDINIDSTHSSLAILNVNDIVVELHINTLTYVVRTNSRSRVNLENVFLRNGPGALVHVISEVGKTGTVNETFFNLHAANCRGLSEQSTYSGDKSYVGNVTSENCGQFGCMFKPMTKTPIQLVENIYSFGQGSYGTRFISAYFQLPRLAQLTKLGLFTMSPGNFLNKAVTLYAVKDKAQWVDPSASTPSADDMVEIVTCTQAVGTSGLSEVSINHTGNNNVQIAGYGGDFSEGRYALLSDPVGSNGIYGTVFVKCM